MVCRFSTAKPAAGLCGLLAHRPQQRIVACASVTEAEIVSDQQKTHAETVEQQSLHEQTRIHRREPGTEFQQHHLLNAVVADGPQLFAQPGQPRRCGIRGEELHWLGLEGDDGRRQTQRLAVRQQTLEDAAMAQMDAVEVADGGDAAPVGGSQIVQASDQPHGALAFSVP